MVAIGAIGAGAFMLYRNRLNTSKDVVVTNEIIDLTPEENEVKKSLDKVLDQVKEDMDKKTFDDITPVVGPEENKVKKTFDQVKEDIDKKTFDVPSALGPEENKAQKSFLDQVKEFMDKSDFSNDNTKKT